MIILGIPILFYTIGFAALCMASRWWALLLMGAAALIAGSWIHEAVSRDVGFGSDTAKTMLTLTALGASAGFATRSTLMISDWQALRGRGLALTLVIFIAVPIVYGLTAEP